MRRFLGILGIAIILASPAMAADMAVKAVPASSNPFLTYSGSGFYWGVGTTSAVEQANVSGNNIFASDLVTNNLTAAGQSIDLEAGYIWGNASVAGVAQWARVYLSGSYQNITGGVSVAATPTTGAASASVASRWSAMQGFDVGADLVQMILSKTGLTNPFPAFTPQLPSNIAVAVTPREYFGGFVTEFGLQGTFGAASGQTVGIAPGIRTGYLWQTVDSTGKPNGGALDMGVAIDWPLKGATFGNVFATNGAPLTLNAGESIGTQYKAYVRYDF